MVIRNIKYRAIQRQYENCPIFTRNKIGLIQISVIIVSFNAPYFLQVCLESVMTSLKVLEGQGEVIVVDNASFEPSVKMIQERFPEVELIVNSENVGFSKAVNQGAQRASGEYILILNPDSVLPEDGLQDILQYADQQINMGALGCRFIDGTGTLLPECKRNIPGIRSAVSKLFGYDLGYYANHIEERSVGEVEVLTGAFMLMKRKLFTELKGFDERFFMFGEDIDLSYRIHKAGYQNLYYGKTSIIHFKGESTVKDASYLRHFYGALEIFYLKHYRHSELGRSILRLLVAGAVWFRSSIAPLRRPQNETVKEFVYCGERRPVFEALGRTLKGMQARFEQNITKIDAAPCTMVLFDSKTIAYSDMLRSFDLMPRHVRKRIISHSGDFFIGSDDPYLQGEHHLIEAQRSESNSYVNGDKTVRSGH